ncbi:hypothetical protein CCR95_15830 [Thiocystis minor]|uniref:hypothetical protein n=1 Tax=Thiocystis minor TaxID=61597 RepID=UPI001913BAD2|nr:hypothetical protein [Thiocystis minor]MBK5965516.1 hypothetical protein [Thiocystis minor]
MTEEKVSSRYFSAPALNRAGLLGNRYALLTSGLMLLLQFAFTDLVPMHDPFAEDRKQPCPPYRQH